MDRASRKFEHIIIGRKRYKAVEESKHSFKNLWGVISQRSKGKLADENEDKNEGDNQA